MKTIIIGASHGGITAALAIKKYQPDHEVWLFEKTDSLGFIPSTINLIYKDYFSFEELEKGETYTGEILEKAGICLFLNTEIIKIDPEEKRVYSDDKEHPYDYLILSMGSEHFLPNPPYLEQPISEKLITYKSKQRLQEIFPRIAKADTITIIGGGLICFELASSLAMDATKKIQIIERNLRPIHRYFDSELLVELAKYLPANVMVYRNESFYRIERQEEQLTAITLSDGTVLSTDEVILAINPQPQSDLLEQIVKLNEDKTVVVDPYLETSAQDIYAIGDLVHSKITNISYDYYFPTISNAKREAVVAAYNITHPHKIACPPIQKTMATKLFGKYLASSGLTAEEALFNGYQIRKIHKHYHKLAHYGALQEKELQIQVLCNKENGQLLGVQLFSDSRQAVELINQFSTFISDHRTLKDLTQVDNFFSPDLSFLPQIFLDLFMEAKE
ncbi:FAD/NAD(P)-binding oxidoreductase [Enterococcus sp.]|uniref:NAD(P)/FAD-dependent oxidoreductase n=1 Tax=Enterococcus sp. TaxID=35783 RepID=UPI0025C4998C|nr:FAD/NAD(P)-binding oxidoreductase [Enterococcus sp.]